MRDKKIFISRRMGFSLMAAGLLVGVLTAREKPSLVEPEQPQSASVLESITAQPVLAEATEPEVSPMDVEKSEVPPTAPAKPTSNLQSGEEQLPSPQPTPVPPLTTQPTQMPARKRSVTVWMHKNDWDSAVQSVATHADLIAEVSPAWYQVAADGRVIERAGFSVNDPALLAIVKEKNIILRPLVMIVPGSVSDLAFLQPIFENVTLRERRVAGIVKLVVDNGYDGIDLDYEGVTLSELPDLATLVEALAEALHAKGKTLAVSIETQPSDNALPAWERIGAAADNVRLMAYGHKSTAPAPIVDFAWMRERLERALRAIPADKLTHGIPTYCQTWEGGTIGSGTWQKYIGSAPTDLQRDTQTNTPFFTENDKNIWCEDAESVKTKMAIGEELGISHFALWRIGGEDPRIWDIVAGLRPS